MAHKLTLPVVLLMATSRLAHGNFNIVISSSTSVSGSHQMVIDGSLQQEFGLGSSESDLRTIIGRAAGRTPTNAYVRSPATNGDWPDLYDRYGWDRVRSTMSAAVLTQFADSGDQRAIIANSTYRNERDSPVTITETLTHNVQDVVEKTYSANAKHVQIGSVSALCPGKQCSCREKFFAA